MNAARSQNIIFFFLFLCPYGYDEADVYDPEENLGEYNLFWLK